MKESPSILVLNDVVWTLVEEPNRRHTEAAYIGGKEQKQTVNIHTFKYKMTCACGRMRYAKPNTLHWITECRICARESLLQKRRERNKKCQ